MNQFMTAKLMYESLFAFNLGKMPAEPARQFMKYALGDPDGPYQPNLISTWGEQETKTLHERLEQAAAADQYHYYAINLRHYQTVFFLYITLKKGLERRKSEILNDVLFQNNLKAYFKTKQRTDVLERLK
jgi:hypothetical protein